LSHSCGPVRLIYSERLIVSNDWSGAITWMARTEEDFFEVGSTWTTGGGSFGLAIAPDRKLLAAGGARDGSEGFELFAIDPRQL
jgi:hypothetical protein